MCGFTYDEVVGCNPRMTQGARSDPATIALLSSALRAHRACKALMLNYRSGDPNQPFFNMLSISPVVHQGNLLLYIGKLQDYSYHIAKLVSTRRTQFCRSAEHYQCPRQLPNTVMSSPRAYARPNVYDFGASLSGSSSCSPAVYASCSSGVGAAALFQPKRLGWSNLILEPEYLADRIVDALHQVNARYERVESIASGEDVFAVNAETAGVACRILVLPDPECPDAFRITCTRLGGDTFAYHDIFRQLRGLLNDAVAVDGTASSEASARQSRPLLAPLTA